MFSPEEIELRKSINLSFYRSEMRTLQIMCNDNELFLQRIAEMLHLFDEKAEVLQYKLAMAEHKILTLEEY